MTLLSPEKFTIKPNSSVVVTAQIKSDLPKEFNGEVLGSWYFVQKTNGTHKIQQGVAIKNNYAYVTSIGLQKGPKVLGDLKLPKARATVNNNVLGVGVTLQNPNPGILANLTTATKIYRLKGNKQILATNQAMAPNSNFEEFIPAGKQNLTPGKYRAVVDGISGMQKWHLTRDFEITATDTKKLNQQIVVYKKPLPGAWIIISSILVLVILVLLWVIFKRRRKDDNDGISEN
ncbi:DUF3324 domain-containing protein [Weissella fabalis]|uniref:DUF3324 domain-containing protein n=1 Tax=Periweissella fabalis TaxID=1070421 RepID=A0A7X6N3U2_9LACO|nr:DUF3324 domain-containing protein [Periweissella fabalis]NKZ24787.1 DUF3324 domain-containing protein [Periweissella fabalis]